MVSNDTHLLIPKIKDGIVIDHIPAGLGAELVKTMSGYEELAETLVTLGLNYASARLGRKDLIKIQCHQLPERFLQHLSLMAPGVTIKEIRDFKVRGKIVTEPPEILTGLMKCPNPRCITNSEPACTTSFHCVEAKPPVFICHYCERHFRLGELKPIIGTLDRKPV